ncbi:MAG: radical SAM protein [Candidatus Thermoplasmatota archaeon]|nr:radical SAM protein [Candidatus Thermoplasmatota archaeon]
MYESSRYNKFFFENDNIFLFNSFTRACVSIEKDEIEKIKHILENSASCKNEDLTNQKILLENGFIIPKGINEIEILEYNYSANYFQTENINVVLVPTLVCNFKCPYCYEEGHKKEYDLKKDYFAVLKKFAEKNFQNKKKVIISLFGGEPLLKKEELFSYLDYLMNHSKNHGYELTSNIVTNGFLLDKKTLTELIRYNCGSIQITLDGKKESHNKLRKLHNDGETFDRIIDNLKMTIRYSSEIKSEVNFILRINLFNQNVQDIESIFKVFTEVERNKIQIYFRPIYKTNYFNKSNSNTIFDLKKFYDSAKKYGFQIFKSPYSLQYCEAYGSNNFFYITPDLKIWKCMNDMTNEKTNIGNIEKTGKVKFNLKNMVEWYQKANPFKDEKCRNCYYLPFCFGGCILYHAKTGRRRCISKDIVVTPYFY